MDEKISIGSWRHRRLWFWVLLVAAAFVLSGGSAFAQAKKADAQKAAPGLVDINGASQKDLESIKGVGPATAKKIIAGRPYKSVDELSRAGLSAKAIEGMKPYVTVGKAPAAVKAPVPPTVPAAEKGKSVKDARPASKPTAAKLAPGTKININTADKAALEALPDIGPVKAQAIINGRPYKSVEDIMKISGIKQKTFDKIKDYITVR